MDAAPIWGRIMWLAKELRNGEVTIAHVAIEVAVALYKLTAANPTKLDEHRIFMAKLIDVKSLDTWIEESIVNAVGDPLTEYRIAQGYSSACIFGSDYATAMRIWRLALTDSREPPVAELEAINANAAKEYDETAFHQHVCRNFMAFLRPHLMQRNDFLDLCCGTGLTTAHLGLKNKRVVGVDLELGGLHAANRSALFSSLHQGAAQALLPTLPSAGFEAVWCCGALYFFANPSWIFDESSRLLRTGGLLCLNAWPSPEEHDVSITREGTFRYCHSHGYLTRCAQKAGLRLIEKSWNVGYNMPIWLLLFEKMS